MFIYDRDIRISIGNSRKASTWSLQIQKWSEFAIRLSFPVTTGETFAEYKAMKKADQDELKDVGGFVGGELREGKRRNGFAGSRDLITLDADNIQPGGTQAVINAVSALGCAYVLYSTRKHESPAPRLRIIVPLDEPCTPDEYEAIARKLADMIGIQIFDPTTFEPVRLMYWPSHSRDSEWVYYYEDRPLLSRQGMLNLYEDWTDVSSWPEVPGAAKIRDRSLKKQGDPLEKKGVVGAFCKTYSVVEAIEAFLPDVYEACDDGERYTYIEGSTTGGAVLYDNGNFLYSHHATDPAGGKLCNAFDLVRLHLFNDQDYDSKPDTPVSALPSFRAMCEYAMQDKRISGLITQERYNQAKSEFEGTPVPEKTDLSWMERLEVSSQTGIANKTINNVLIIIENDPAIKGKFYHDAFANRPVVCAPLPWDTHKGGTYTLRQWVDEDDAGLRHYIERRYSITGKDKIYDAMAVYAATHKTHKLKEYLTGLKWDSVKRLDTLLIDYFGAEDSAYTKAVTRKTLVAAVARVLRPGIKFDNMLILAGAQGIGKSTFFKKLGKDWYSDSLVTFEGKDAAELIQGYWIIEAGELTGLNKSEMNTVKQFLSRTEDVYRQAYGRRTANFPRSCIIVGTTNDDEFLKDRTGNRRFWPVDLGVGQATKSVFDQLDQEVDQIWAEAIARFNTGEKLFLQGSVAEDAVEQQEKHKEHNAKEGIVKEFLDRKVPVDWHKRDLAGRRDFWNYGYRDVRPEDLIDRDRICAAEVWCECFMGDLKQMKRSDSMEINSILSIIDGWEKIEKPVKFGQYYGVQRGYRRTKTHLDTLAEKLNIGN